MVTGKNNSHKRDHIERRSHPSKDIVSSEGTELEGKKIVLCITGSVAAYRAIDLARLLMRHGAEVFPVMTEATSSMLLSAEMMKWATGNEVVTKLTGNLEHIMLADYNMSDLILVYPCTANTIGKMANGIDDTPVTSVLSVALGSGIPIVIAPAMHEAMHSNDFIQENIEKLKRNGVTFIAPSISEGKAKVAEPQHVLDFILQMKGKTRTKSLAGKKILVTSGSTVEYIDPIRVITNKSSGTMGNAIAYQAEKMGADVTLIYGHGSNTPRNSRIIRVDTSSEMHDAVMSELSSGKYDVVILAAAVTDYGPAKKSGKKIDTRAGKMDISLVPTKKIIDKVKRVSKKTFLVAFKAEHGVDDKRLVGRAFKKLEECDGDLVVANDVGREGSKIGSDKNEVFIIDRRKKVLHLPLENKEAIARKLLEIISASTGKRQ